jgi:ATP/maltotriose-dependent transcriptional regulator MalT/DNA-binding SARP family transcriptional activator
MGRTTRKELLVENQECRTPTPERVELPAKLIRPRLTKTYRRIRLVEMLDQAFEAPAVWIGAQPGAGKTTLAASWLDAGERPSLWYQVDAGDADLATFFHHLGLAAEPPAPRHKLPLPHLTPEYLPGIEIFARRFFEELFRRMPKDCVLVLDNIQDSGADSPLNDIARMAVESIPPHVKMLFISRVAPPQTFARLRANGQLAVLEPASIRLTLDEAKGIAALRGHAEEIDVTALNERTHGWVAGLVLMLHGADERHHADVSSVANPPDMQTLFNYFASEVVRGLDEARQQMLITSALLQKMRVSDIESLCGNTDAGKMLAELQQENYFTYRLSPTLFIYEYHPLFREFLLTRLEASLAPAALALLRVRAAEYAAAAENMDEAVFLWSAAKAWAALSQYVCRIAPMLLEQGRGQTLAGWIEALPREERNGVPWLHFWFGQCRLPFAPAEARTQFEEALALFEEQGDRAGALLAWAGLVDTAIHEGQGLGALDGWIEAFDRIAGAEPLPAALHDRIVVQMFNALVLRQPHHSEIGTWTERAFVILQSGADPVQRLIAGVYLCIYFTWMGEPRRARQSLDWLTSLVRGVPAPPLMTQLVSATAGMYAWMAEADTAQSLALVEEALASGERSGVYVWQHHLLCHGAAAALSAGDLTTAQRLLRRFSEGLAQARPIDVAYYHFLCNWEALGRGDFGAAEWHANEVAVLRERVGLTFGYMLIDLGKARTCIARGRFDEARPSLDAVHRLAATTGSKLIEYTVCIDEALLALHQGDETALQSWLTRAFGLGREQGLVNFHGWEAAPMARLCAYALGSGIETEYIQDLIRRRALVPPPAVEPPATWPWPLRINTFGRFGLVRDGQPVNFEGRVQKRALDLLRALIAFGGREVGEQKICDTLWPDADGDAARTSLKMTLHRLRGLIGHDAVVLRGSKLSLDTRLCWVDAWSFENLANQLATAGDTISATERVRLGDRMQSLYRGPFLDGEDDAYAIVPRERLRGCWLRTIDLVASHLQLAGAPEPALVWYERGLSLEPLAEPFHQGVMRICLQNGRAAEGLAAYERLRRLLATQLKVSPAPESEALVRALRTLSP